MSKTKSGFVLLEALVGIFLMVILSMGIYASYAFGIKMSNQNRLRIQATTIAEKEVEAIKSMKYATIGISGGIPTGNLVASKTETDNGTDFTVRTSVRYIDDAYDGKSPTDTVPADYKQVEIKVDWPTNMENREVILNTLISPPQVETNLNMGVLILNVVDGVGNPISGANFHIKNTTVSPVIDLNEESDSNGSLTLPGAPIASTSYQVTVSKNGYETVATYPPYPITTFNPIDTHLSVIKGKVTSKVFVIDLFGHLNLHFIDIANNNLSGLIFSLVGGRTIGTTIGSAPVPVYFFNQTGLVTDADGKWISPDLGKGPYNFTLTSADYDIISMTINKPWLVSPNMSSDVTLTLGKKTDNILVVTVKEVDGVTPIADAAVQITDATGIPFQTVNTDSNGLAYFPQIENPTKIFVAGGNYTINISKDLYKISTSTAIVSGLTRKNITLLKQ